MESCDDATLSCNSIKDKNAQQVWLLGGVALDIYYVIYNMKKQCARCGVHIKEETNRIWCRKCVERVNEELEGKADRDFRYYFRWHLRHKK